MASCPPSRMPTRALAIAREDEGGRRAGKSAGQGTGQGHGHEAGKTAEVRPLFTGIQDVAPPSPALLCTYVCCKSASAPVCRPAPTERHGFIEAETASGSTTSRNATCCLLNHVHLYATVSPRQRQRPGVQQRETQLIQTQQRVSSIRSSPLQIRT